MEGLRKLNEREMKEIKGGEPITLTSIMAILTISIIVVVCYRFFVSPKGSLELPGGFEFEWGTNGK